MKLEPKDAMEFVIKSLNIPYEKEYKFDDKRKFKFDFYIPMISCGIEYEGIFASKGTNNNFSGKSRHTNVVGYSRDATKYNLAQIDGFIVLRYTAINYGELLNDLTILLKEYEQMNNNQETQN